MVYTRFILWRNIMKIKENIQGALSKIFTVMLLMTTYHAYAIKGDGGRSSDGLLTVFRNAYNFIFEGNVTAFVLIIGGLIFGLTVLFGGVGKAWTKGIDWIVGGGIIVGVPAVIALLFSGAGDGDLVDSVNSILIPLMG